ncbi:MAG: carbohydrate ABC transporter permease [Lachnospiraceae bacterium]|nr:carbohydrate ABC transporter permease [Lachnospiraceae bacterium]
MKDNKSNIKVKKKQYRLDTFDIVNYVIMIAILIIIAYPIYFTIIASFSEPSAVATNKVSLWPVGFNLKAYEHVFRYKPIWTGYANSIFYTTCGTLFSLFMTIPAAYAMSKKKLPLKGLATLFFAFTMYFGGGTIPTYVQVRNMHLLDTRIILVIMGAFGVYNMIMTRAYFSNNISESLYEAAEIDGSGELRKFFAIALPLSKPIIAVMTLYYAVGHWNSYFSAMLYTSSPELKPLQLVLRDVLILNQKATDPALLADQMANGGVDAVKLAVEQANMAYAMKFSVVFIASAPMLAMYPFVQKYFVKGAMIGSVKE